MKIINSVIVLLAVAVLTGCFDSKPSTSDAKKAIENVVSSQCDYVTIENFKVSNGIPRGERNYSLDVTYSISIKPLPENAKIWNEYIEGKDKADAGNTMNIYALNGEMANRFQKECKLPISIMKEIFNSVSTNYDKTAILGQGISLNCDQTISMVKSDNGWVMAR